MSTTLKMMTTALVAAALTAGAFLSFGPIRVVDSVPSEGGGAPSIALPPASSPHLVGRVPKRLADLEPDADELAFLRAALEKERQRKVDAAPRPDDSGLDILERVFEYGLDPWPLMMDAEAFRSRVHPSEVTPVVIHRGAGDDVTKVSRDELGSSGVIEFGPGIFQVSLANLTVPEDADRVEIRGAGKDETTLILKGEFMVRTSIENLSVSDLTFECRHETQVLDVRGRVAAAFTRVRFRDWASGGYGAPLGIGGWAYLSCLDCDFVQSSDRGGQSCAAFRGPALAVFERCTFEGPVSVVVASGDGTGGRGLFLGCRFEEARLTDSRILMSTKEPRVAIRVRGGQATYGSPQWRDETRHERWGAPFAKVSDLTIDPTIRRCTLADLSALLRAFDGPSDEHPYALAVSGWSKGVPVAFDMAVADHGGRRVNAKGYDVRRDLGAWRFTPHSGGARFVYWARVGSGLPEPLDLLDALEKSGLSPNTSAMRVRLQLFAGPEGVSKDRFLSYVLEDGRGLGPGRSLLLDANTGEVTTWDEALAR